MPKKPFSIDLLVDLVKHVPEGYLGWQQIHDNFDVKKINGSKLASSDDLVRAEQVIACADLYLWLARTPEFRSFGPCYEEVRTTRYALAEQIDQALLSRLDTRKRCTSCGRILPLSHHYRLCEHCYRDRSYDYWDDDTI